MSLTGRYQDFAIGEWLEHVQNQHWRTVDLTLERISRVWENLDGRCAQFTLVVAGTNGKGSCVSLLDGVFQESGKSTGAFTSPHLLRFNERIMVNGEAATDEDICSAFRQIEDARGSIPLTYFEYGTLAALLVFQQNEIDVAILEVGMGGRLDAVNMVGNDLVLISSIGIDHQQWLGADREKIAAEKAGVIKKHGLAVCADADIPHSIIHIANQQKAVLLGADREYVIENNEKGLFWQSSHPGIPDGWRSIGPLTSPFNGQHQIRNMGGVVAALALSSEKTGVTVEHLQSGFNRARLVARCQVVRDESGQNLDIIIDVAHNRDSAVELSRFLDSRPCCGETYAVFGVLEDKTIDQIIAPMRNRINHWILATLNAERGQTGAQLGAKLDRVIENSHWVSRDSPIEAYLEARQRAKSVDRIVIFGSFHTVGDILGYIKQAN